MLNPTLRENLYRLAEAILPLGRWLAGTPSQRPDALAPWRDPFAPQLGVRDFGLVEFIERRIADSADDDASAQKWKQVESDPLGVFNGLPKKGPAWRAARKLKDPIFGIVVSDNVEVTLDHVKSGQTFVLQASSRREFYGYAFPAFANVVAAHPPTDWEAFRESLANDDPILGWPAICPVSAGRFSAQFAKDLLYGLMGMFDQPAKPQTTAVLAELGQHRRKGNSYSVEDVRAAVAALQLALPS
jgi:hypothetical protein